MSSPKSVQNDSGNVESIPQPSNLNPQRVVTTIPGKFIHPSKLVAVLEDRFGDDFCLELRMNIYTITAATSITFDDIQSCY
ncbi:hypothetical protein GGR51DRAFT_574211 [Nemania sp. FL0031]|nr:hypothetical protein GGR51DRAFT_574211 [Nemania sp. FL0031]